MLITKKNYPLKKICTFQIGGPASLFTKITSIKQLKEAFTYIQKNKIKFFILGNGSNCLFNDIGFNGLVIKNSIKDISIHDNIIKVGAGYNLAKLSALSCKYNLSGLEFATTIPATIGGAIYMNASAHKQRMQDIIDDVTFLNIDGSIKIFKKNELTFSYRHSPFQHMQGAIVTTTLRMTKSDKCREKQQEVIAYREKTQPIKQKNAGCIFRNPSQEISAGKLIEDCGLKGIKIGGASISSLHANFIINENNATAQDVLNLISLIQKEVKQKTNIELMTEICHVN
jgi:UDP-N-acetylmuramate dehydrogenase